MTTPVPDRASPAVFLDRDGTLMRDVEYCGDPAKIEVFAGVPEALRRLKAAGFKLFVITNQSGIGRGFFTEEDYRAVERELGRQIGEDLLEATYFCADHPDNASPRRKPAPGMVHEAQRDHNLDLSRSFFIGDKPLDAECGRAAGVRTIVVQTGIEKPSGPTGADWDVRALTEAVEIILNHAR